MFELRIVIIFKYAKFDLVHIKFTFKQTFKTINTISTILFQEFGNIFEL